MASLLDMFVTFAARGHEEVKAAMDGVKSASDKVAESVNALGKGVNASLAGIQTQISGLQRGIEGVGKVSSVIYAKLAGDLGAYVRSGIAASAMGDQLTLATTRLSLALAGLFRPEIEKVISLVRQATDWFARLSDVQRENVARWIEAALAGAALGVVLPKIVGYVQGIVKAFSMLATAGALPVLGAIAAGFLVASAAVTVMNDGLGGLAKAVQPLLDAFTGLWEAIKEPLGRLTDSLEAVLPIVVQMAVGIVQAVTPLIEIVLEIAADLSETLLPVLQAVGDMFSYVTETVGTVISVLSPLLKLIGEIYLGWVAWTVIIPKIVAGIWMVITALRAEIVALITKLSLMGPSGWAQLAIGAGIAAAAIIAHNVAVGDSAEASAEKQKKAAEKAAAAAKGNRGAAGMKVGGPEDITAAFYRMNVAALNATAGIGGKSKDDQQIDRLDIIVKNTAETRDAVVSRPSGIVR